MIGTHSPFITPLSWFVLLLGLATFAPGLIAAGEDFLGQLRRLAKAGNEKGEVSS